MNVSHSLNFVCKKVRESLKHLWCQKNESDLAINNKEAEKIVR